MIRNFAGYELYDPELSFGGEDILLEPMDHSAQYSPNDTWKETSISL